MLTGASFAAGFRGRAKLIAKVDPMPDAVPSMLRGYNGKPVLLTASSDVSVGTVPGEAGGNSYMEIDCNMRHVRLHIALIVPQTSATWPRGSD